MPQREGTESRLRKRKRTIEAAPVPDPQPQPPAKRQKRSRQPRSRTPPEFWDRVPLCRRALREFNRRTVRPVISKPPVRSVVKGDLIKQLKLFARRGGPDLRDIRGYPELEIKAVSKMSSSRSRSSRGRSGKASSTLNPSTRPTTYSSKDPAFERALIDGNFYPHGYDYSDDDAPVPNDVDDIYQRLQLQRPSLSPSRFTAEDFRRFQRSNMRATTESTVMESVFPIIKGTGTIPSGQNYPFNNLEPLANNISNPKPDYFNGSRPKQVHPQVLEDLGKYIIPSTYDSRPLLPNFFVEAKGPTGSAAEMKLQITQDLAAGARGMQSYRQDQPVFDGNAYTIGATYHSGHLQLYAMHPTQPTDPNGQPEYHTTQIRSFGMTDTADTFRKGAAAFRNAQDWAKEQRDEFIVRANEIAARHGRQERQERPQEGEEEENE